MTVNFYDLHGYSKRILYYPTGKTMIGPAKSPLLIYDDGSFALDKCIVGRGLKKGKIHGGEWRVKGGEWYS